MPGIIAEEYSTWFYKTCYILTFAKQSALNMGIQGASLRFFCFYLLSLAFWHPNWHPNGSKVEKSRDIKGYEPI